MRLCGLDLDVMLVERDESDWAQAERLHRLTADERLRRMNGVARQMRQLQARQGPECLSSSSMPSVSSGCCST